MDLKKVCVIASWPCLSALVMAQAPAPAPPPALRDVTVTAIPGIVAAGATWKTVWQGAGNNADGIVGTADGGVLFAQEDLNQVSKLDRDDRVSVFLSDTRGGGSLAIDAQGRIITVQRMVPRAVAFLAPERKMLADTLDGKPVGDLGRLNDLVADKKSGAYFTVGGAYYAAASGRITSLGDNMRTNGIILSRDEKTLYITNREVVLAFDVAADGTTSNRRDFARLEGGGVGDGMAIDAAGRVYVTSLPGVQVLSSEGKYVGLIPTPRNAISVAFSGQDKKTLYVVCVGALDADGKEMTRQAATIFKIPMVSQGFAGRAK